MTVYGQFCPVAKATEIIGDKWTMLILRELLLGTCRFSDFQRALSRISPTILSRRLKLLEEKGIVVRKRVSGHDSFEYHPTPAGKELEPVVEQIAIWGMRWARSQLSDEELDADLLMWDIRRRILTDHLPGGETVLCFSFADVLDLSGASKAMSCWLVIDDDEVDFCDRDPGKDVDLYISSKIRDLIEVWEGDQALKTALREERLTAIGDRRLIRSMPDWFGLSTLAHIRPAEEAQAGLKSV